MSSTTAGRRVLWLMRHGESDWNVSGTVQGHQDTPRLTDRGRVQAERAGATLAHRPISAIYASDLARARESAAIVGGHVNIAVTVDPRLRERGLGVAEGQAMESLTPDMTGIADGRVQDVHVRPEAGESLEDVRGRCTAFVEWLAAQPMEDEIVVVSHGGCLRVLLATLTGTPLGGMPWLRVPNASVQRVDAVIAGPVLSAHPHTHLAREGSA